MVRHVQGYYAAGRTCNLGSSLTVAWTVRKNYTERSETTSKETCCCCWCTAAGTPRSILTVLMLAPSAMRLRFRLYAKLKMNSLRPPAPDTCRRTHRHNVWHIHTEASSQGNATASIQPRPGSRQLMQARHGDWLTARCATCVALQQMLHTCL